MDILLKLTPAEVLTLFQIDQNISLLSKEYFKELLKVTMIDLTMKQVIEAREDESPDSSDEAGALIQISAGKQWSSYQAKSHELPFTQVFSPQEPNLAVLKRQYLQMVVRHSQGAYQYVYQMILKKGDIAAYTRGSFWQKMAGVRKLSEDGETLVKDIRAHFAAIREMIHTNSPDDQPHLSQILQRIKGHLFLIDGLDMDLVREMLKRIEKGGDLDHAIRNQEEDLEDDVEMDWMVFDMILAAEMIDDSFDLIDTRTSAGHDGWGDDDNGGDGGSDSGSDGGGDGGGD